MKKQDKIFFIIIFIITTFSFVNLVINIIRTYPNQFGKLILSLVGCIFVDVLILISFKTKKKFIFKIPKSLFVLFVIFCFLSIVLGDINGFYSKIAVYDSMMHFTSGVILSIYGYVIINTINEKLGENKLKTIMLSIFAFCFAITLGTLWEILEFTLDDTMGTNMQVYKEKFGVLDDTEGKEFIGHEALKDTMDDNILNVLGSLLVILASSLEFKRDKNIYNKYIEE